MLALNGRQRGVLPEAGGLPTELYLQEDGPGYCLYEPLRRHSPATAALLDRIHEVGHTVSPAAVTGTDAVHGDFHPGNILVAIGTPAIVAGVVDWTGAHAGNCGLDLVTLGFSLDHDAAATRVREIVRERIAADVGVDALLTSPPTWRSVKWTGRSAITVPPRPAAGSGWQRTGSPGLLDEALDLQSPDGELHRATPAGADLSCRGGSAPDCFTSATPG